MGSLTGCHPPLRIVSYAPQNRGQTPGISPSFLRHLSRDASEQVCRITGVSQEREYDILAYASGLTWHPSLPAHSILNLDLVVYLSGFLLRSTHDVPNRIFRDRTSSS